ncbi:uncharacterized protein LOC139930835 [Centroberyx gerrardi]|uniref:uncharacterized protein n=1 Tax=Centroberyx gerrardi TaxID=166262 RepID=UPI003AADA924
MAPPGSSDQTAASKTFSSQTTLILEVAVESAVAVMQEALGQEWQPQFSSVLDLMAREAIRKICRVFRELYLQLAKENEALKGRVGRLEDELRSKVRRNAPPAEKSGTQTVYKIKQSDGPALSLDINQSAADPAALAMAILNSAKSSSGAGSSSQVPLVIISQPVPTQTAAGQTGPASQVLPGESGRAVAAPTTTTQTAPDHQTAATSQVLPNPYISLLDISQVFPGVTSLPAAEGQDTSDPADPSVATSRATSTARPEIVEVEIKMENGEEDPEEDSLSPGQRALSDEDRKELERKRRRELYKQKRVFCELCNKGFHQQHQLKKHMVCHSKPFPCDRCDKGFYKEKTLQTHLLAHKAKEAREKNPERLLDCDQCDRKFKLPRQLKVHLILHERKKNPLKCHSCDKTFATPGSLRYHEFAHAKVKPFICDVCGKGFTRRKSLREHQTVHTGAKPFPCLTCGKRFTTASNLRVHKRSHSDERPFKCSECEKAFKCKMGLLQHRVVHSGEKPFVCQTCGLSFGLKYNFQRHLRLHNGEKPFRCEKCGERFSGTWALKTHMLVHGVEKPFMCDLCGKTFFYNCQLLKHQQLVHEDKGGGKISGRVSRRNPTGAKPFSCKICLKSFCSANSLKTHEKSHAENKEFTCDVCDKSFHLKHLYLYHMRQHSGERPYVCGVCEKGFLLMCQLKQHQLLHTGVKPHKCEQCGKEFRTPQNYHRHLLVHTGEKPYECNVCGRKFRQSNQLKSHMQIHTGVKLYSCERCGLGFSDSRQLKKHNCADKYQNSFGAAAKRRKQKNVFPWTE